MRVRLKQVLEFRCFNLCHSIPEIQKKGQLQRKANARQTPFNLYRSRELLRTMCRRTSIPSALWLAEISSNVKTKPVNSSAFKPLDFGTPTVFFSTAEIIKALLSHSIITNYDTKTPAPVLDPPPSLSLEDAADWPCASPSPSPTNRML